MYTLILAMVTLVSGTGPGHIPGVASTNVSGFKSKVACEAALAKIEKKLGINVGPEMMGQSAYIEVHGVCVRVGAVKP